ncbi:MAG: hypothetical protein AAFV86_06375 [Pseudomonadota bacterium]
MADRHDAAPAHQPFRARRPRRPGVTVTLTAALAAAALVVVPAPAPAGPEESETGIDLDAVKRDLDRLWERMVEEVEPALKRLDATIDTLKQIDGLEHYEDPVVLENGDILIRRRADAPPLPEPEEPPLYGEGGTDL